MEEHQEHHEEHEEFEQIPWSQLTGGPSSGKRRLLYVVAAALGALVLAILVGRAFLSTSSDPQAPGSTLAGDAEESASADGTVATRPDDAGSLLYEEADLLAFTGSPGERAAVARAEWFVTDYFTADLEPSGSADVRTALPAGADLPDMPQDGTEGLSYVEWARAYAVEEVGEVGGGLFRVGVAFRSLGAPPDGGFSRLPVRAVTVMVAVNEDGGSVVVDLPTPVPVPAGPEPASWPTEGREPPRRVAEAALARVAGWGEEPRLVEAARTDDGWRVVLTVADEVGNRWPAVVVVPAGVGEG